MVRYLLGGAAVAAATAGRVGAQTPGVYRTAAVLGFVQTHGNFEANNRARVQGLRIQINPNRTFVLAIPNTVFTFAGPLTPLAGGGFSFTDIRSYRTATNGLVVMLVDGRVGMVNGRVVMSLTARSASSLAAVVNNTRFGATASNGYIATVVLTR